MLATHSITNPHYKGKGEKMQDKAKLTRQEVTKKRNESSKRFNVVLTKPEGEALERIIADNECSNLSQLCKKIAQGTLKLW